MLKNTILFLVVSLIIISCSSVMLTGRKQVSLVSDAELATMATDNYSQFLSENTLSTNTKYQEMVRRVGKNIQLAVTEYMTSQGQAAILADYKWEFNVVDDPTVNAWAMPGGKIVFYEGIMPLCANDEGVAVVMGHEIAHVLARHGNERMSQQMLLQYGQNYFALFTASQPEEKQYLYSTAFALGAQYGVMLPYSRKHESEADNIGQIIMAMAGYDPAVAPEFWKKMAANSGGDAPMELMSTHPSESTRIRLLTENIPNARAYLKK